MARWRLTEAHYLFGHPPDLDETEWEYKETDRVTGRERRKRFKVPFHFDAETIVCLEGKGLPSDCVFEGPPTHAMEPIDDEAKALSAKLPKVMTLDEFLPSNGFSASLLTGLERQLDELTRRMPAPAPVATSGVSREEFDRLQAQLAELMAQNAALKDTPRRI